MMDTQMRNTRSVQSIERVDCTSLTAEHFAQTYRKPGIPVILTGLIQPEWDWNLDYLCQQLGDRSFLLRYYGKERYQQDKRTWTNIGSGVPPQSKSFAEYAHLLRTHEAHEQDIYLAKCSIESTPLANTPAAAAIRAGLAQLGFAQAASPLNLWVGPVGHTEALHYDPMDGTLMQLHGAKRVVLFPPSQTGNLYPFPFYLHLRYGLKLRSWFSQVYPDRPDFEAFPRLKTALKHKLDIILHPGEVLFIPAGWWHEVTALGSETDRESDAMVCSLNRFWRIYPTRRAIFNWGRWRAYLGSACAVPNVLLSLVIALLSRDRAQKIKEILRLL